MDILVKEAICGQSYPSFKIATANGLHAQTLLANTNIPPLEAAQESFECTVAKSQTLMCTIVM